ncbi:hypothetical protein DelCs14_1793 [Delftia sp. Cs1-4]|uniref:hypothetical protein n=1 Tax=Delftia sp. (strain Cs1-4) TaxID=742013 RepID=UPI00020E7BE3|nr:hypothetical protein [Delftia sp. Cs1-4]AEF88818.1 hypothetical protein DelCs14_1793 [Delftia sp. Cs1-4]
MGYLNPLFKLPAAQGLLALGAPEKAALGRLMSDLRRQANDEAERAWGRRKGPMACYWRAVSTYARHIAHVLRRPRHRRCSPHAYAAMAFHTAQGTAMTAQDFIDIFEDLSATGLTGSLDEALTVLAEWLAQRRANLSDEDFTALTAAGGAMYEGALRQRVAAATVLPVR